MGENFDLVAKYITLKVLDTLWVEHLENMEHLRDSVRLRAFGQRDPLVEYKIEAKRLWENFFDQFEFLLFQAFFALEEKEKIESKPKENFKVYHPKGKKIGRNDPCPCGSGKKYKNCCLKKERRGGKVAR